MILPSKISQPVWLRDPPSHALEVGDVVHSRILDYEIVTLGEESNQEPRKLAWFIPFSVFSQYCQRADELTHVCACGWQGELPAEPHP